MNCPYGRALGAWAAKCVAEAALGAEIVALVPSRTDTAWFDTLFSRATATLFWRGRIKFVDPRAPAGMMWHEKRKRFVPLAPAAFPSAVFYFGDRPGDFSRAFHDAGRMVIDHDLPLRAA